MAAFVLNANETRGQTFRVFGQTVTERITAEDSGGAYYVMEELSPPGTGVPPHRHTHEDEIVQVLAGTFEIFLDGEVSVVEAGATLHFARGTYHGFRNIGTTDGRTLWFATPGTATQALLRTLSTLPEGPPDLARLAALHEAYGIEMQARIMVMTPGLKMLQEAGIAFTLHPYPYDPKAEATGLQAAQALGIDPAVMLKTLMVEVDGKPACCVIPSDRQLSMKRVAAAFGGKSAAMMPAPKAEKLTGYHVGGISPFGQKRAVPTAFEATACTAERVWINAGQRGLLLSLTPDAALAALAAKALPLIA